MAMVVMPHCCNQSAKACQVGGKRAKATHHHTVTPRGDRHVMLAAADVDARCMVIDLLQVLRQGCIFDGFPARERGAGAEDFFCRRRAMKHLHPREGKGIKKTRQRVRESG